MISMKMVEIFKIPRNGKDANKYGIFLHAKSWDKASLVIQPDSLRNIAGIYHNSIFMIFAIFSFTQKNSRTKMIYWFLLRAI